MKFKKVKQFLLCVGLSILGLLTLDSVKTNATIITYSDGVDTGFSYNSGLTFQNENGASDYIIISSNNSGVYSFLRSNTGYNYSYNNCTMSQSAQYVSFSCADFGYIDKTGSYNTTTGFYIDIYRTNNKMVLSQIGNSSIRFYFLPNTGGASSEDLEEAFNEGYNEGVIFGSNNGLMISSCSFSNVVTGACSSQYYSLTNGSIDFDSLNDYVYNLGTGESYTITFTFTDNISADVLFYIRFKETEGANISFYNNNTLLETLYNDDFDSNQSDYYKVARLSDFGQISTPFNKIVINNINYDYAISEFGVLQYQSYNLGEENGEIFGRNLGFTLGYMSGYDNGYLEGQSTGNNLVGLVGAIFTGPVTMLQSIFNFNILGVNMVGFLFSILTLLVVIWLIKRFI